MSMKFVVAVFRVIGGKEKIHFFNKMDVADFGEKLKKLSQKGHKILSGKDAETSASKGDIEVTFRNPEDFSLLLRVLIRK